MKLAISALLRVVVILAVLYGIWLWGFCRFYVPVDHMAIVIAKVGKALPADRILAEPGEIGVRAEVLGEGRHFLNPIFYEWEIRPVLNIPSGQVGIVTAKVGQALPEGEFLAEAGQMGIQRQVLGPGKYRLNPHGYNVDIVDAVSIPIGYIGVITSLSGEKAPDGEFARGNQKGIREQVLHPGLYYVNAKQFKINVLEIGVNQVSLQGKLGGEVITKTLKSSENEAIRALNQNVLQEQQLKREEYVQKQLQGADQEQGEYLRQRMSQAAAPQSRTAARAGVSPTQVRDTTTVTPAFVLTQFVEFPSRDGFQISLDMTVEFELLTSDIARTFRDYGDLTVLVDNIIMPQVLSISRLKGSAYRAIDFIVGEGREKFQTDLTTALKTTLKQKNIMVHNTLVRHVQVPEQILAPIQQTSVALEQQATLKEKQNTAKMQAQLNTELSLIDQNRETVTQETAKLKAEIQAEQEKQVAQIQGQTLKLVAEVEQQAAAIRGEKTRKLGEAKADVITLVEGEKARGFQLKVQAFGDPAGYNLWEMARHLNDQIKVNILHAGQGTLWTDLKNADLAELGGATQLKSDK